MAWPPGDWFVDFSGPADLIAYQRARTVVSGRTRWQEYEIFENRLWGRMLVLDGRLQSAEADEFIYHEALVLPALLAHPEPRRVLVLGGGEGATLREVLRSPQVGRAVMVDIDRELVEVCKEWLPTFHRGAFDDQRAELVFADGRDWLAGQEDGAFEVIILDLTEPLEKGPALKLFTREMYALSRRKLSSGGLLAVQSGSAGPWCRLLPDLNCTLKAVFPRVAAYGVLVPSFMELYGFHLAGGEDFTWPAAELLASRLQSRGLTGLRWLTPEMGAALAHLPRHLQDRLRQGRVLTDASPFKPGGGGAFLF